MNLKLLKNKKFTAIIFSEAVSLIGSRMQSFALSLYVLKITGSATKFAAILSIAFLPKLILSPVAGVFVDWLERKKIAVLLNLISGLIVGSYALIYVFNKNTLSTTAICALVLILSFISTIFEPAIYAIIPSIVNEEDLVDANSINTIISSGSMLLAPVLGAAVFNSFGLLWILIVNAFSFIFSGITEFFIRIPKNNIISEKISLKLFITDFTDGIKFIKNNKIILASTLTLLLLNFFTDPILSVGMPYILKNILKIDDVMYGLFQSAFIIPMFIAPIMCTFLAKKSALSNIIY